MHWTTIVSFIALAAIASVGHAAWDHAHGDSANSGFAKVVTLPAASPSAFADVGKVAPGANPVTGPDGTVYGNLSGELIALHANGAPYWTRKLNLMHGGIFASPVIGADGSIYVVSAITVRDHRGGVYVSRNYTYLRKFNSGGAWLYWVRFPTRYQNLPQWTNAGATTAPPSIWRFNGAEAILVPVRLSASVAPAAVIYRNGVSAVDIGA